MQRLIFENAPELFYHENSYYIDSDLAKATTWKEVYLQRFFHNLDVFKDILNKDTKIMIPVKANAYGHGMVGMAKALEEKLSISAQQDKIWLGVANIMEGVTLRRFQVGLPILVLGPLQESFFDYYQEYDLKATITTFEELAFYLKKSQNVPQSQSPLINVHIKFDTGMGRLGIPFMDLPKVIRLLKDFSIYEVEGVYSHLATSDEPGDENTLSQIENFYLIRDEFSKAQIGVNAFHLANSGGALNFPQSRLDMVRLGLSLYGYYPSRESEMILNKSGHDLKQVMEIKSRVSAIKELPKGHGISYGRIFITENKTLTALVPIGYGDGFPRILSNDWHILFEDRFYPIRGRVSMDQIVIERDETGPNVGDEVIIMGECQTKGLWADQWAKKLNTIAYEILCSFSSRVPILYIK